MIRTLVPGKTLENLFKNKRARLGLIYGTIAAAIFLASCASTDRVVLLPPAIVGATFVGSGECALCHNDVTDHFDSASHAHLTLSFAGGREVDIGCESCHGPASLHVESGGELAFSIHNPGRSAESCFQCHGDIRGRFHLMSSHPVMEGKMSCTDCHDPHVGTAVIGKGSLTSANDNCISCHQAQAGPYAFEHEAMRDGCTTCHEVHGSVNPMLLKSRSSNLCLQCHMVEPAGTTPGGAAIIMIGGRDHSAFLSRGTCWVAGCHEAVHGSHVNSSLRY
jgi:predicted CXXCH cytochrome family protein